VAGLADRTGPFQLQLGVTELTRETGFMILIPGFVFLNLAQRRKVS